MSAPLALCQQSVGVGTRRRYDSAYKEFLKWVHDQGRKAPCARDVDQHMADFVQRLYNKGGQTGTGKQRAKNALFGLIFAEPWLKPHMVLARRALTGWEKLFPAKSYPPLTWELAAAIALVLASTFGSSRWATAVLLAFDCLLRLGELLALRREDVAFCNDPRIGALCGVSLLRIRRSKTGLNKSVTISDPAVASLLFTVVRRTEPGAFLFPWTQADFRTAFHEACAQLGLSARYVPHSLRHGQATRLYLLGVPLADIMLRGRWQASSSAQRYIQAGPALLLAQQVPDRAATLGAVAVLNLVDSVTVASRVG